MVRSFDGTPVDPAWLPIFAPRPCGLPTAGNSAGVRFHTIGPDLMASTSTWRPTSSGEPTRVGLRVCNACGAIALVTSRRGEYVARYAEADKRSSGLDDESNWPIPTGTRRRHGHDGVIAPDRRERLAGRALGQLSSRGGDSSLARIDDEDLFATVLIGRADGNDVPSASLAREIPSRESRVRAVGR